MGHLRLGRLPKTQRWRQLIGTLELTPGDTEGIALGTLLAAERRLREAANDASLTHSFWLLVRVSQAARGSDFQDTLASLGLPAESDTSIFRFISAVSDHLRLARAYDPESGQIPEIAS